MSTFERPSYITPDAVPVCWAVPTTAYTLDVAAHPISQLAEMISAPLAGKPRSEATTVTFLISSELSRSANFYGGITAAEAEQLIRAVLG